MQGDFSLNPLAYRDGVSRVLFQQGRVQLDSDANELTEALIRAMRAQTMDIIGAHGGLDSSFEISHDQRKGVMINYGTYYVDGIRCLNWPAGKGLWEMVPVGEFDDSLRFVDQPNYWPERAKGWPLDENKSILFYLDVFERHISAAEDDSLRELALLGPDTASRAVVIWQVKSMLAEGFLDSLRKKDLKPTPPYDWPYVALNLLLRSGVRMSARAKTNETEDPCTIAPDAKYRGAGNRLFRVEIHKPGRDPSEEPTYKFSADNASIVFPVRYVAGNTVHLDALGRDDRTRIRVNDWVEYVDDEIVLMGQANPLRRVVEVHPMEMTVLLNDILKAPATAHAAHPILRRWASNAQPVVENQPLLLADGVEVEFSRPESPVLKGGYRTGDYWLIPARLASGDVVWPVGKDGTGKTGPLPMSPQGVDHHYAPLAVLDGKGRSPKDYRRTITPLAKI